ncbi:hypothetical protein BCR35DRAFT_40928 [Leucosporidium creatinivorum]|uniref:Uncharacterized protein n=1 Tax=Leucosporidium creatinivorum TaxID=106004 RepID=A0A1Y2C736_9BASI|nr:hypothetical protein BCR35DRAFT_40928 [Leucosporidium creatinivorum]
MVHNWKIGSDRIDPARYSTSAMLSTSFPRIHLLPSNTQVRTLLPTTPTVSPFLTSSFPTSFAALYSHIIDWTVNEYESYLDDDDASSSHPLSPSTSSSSLTRRTSSTTDLTPPSSSPRSSRSSPSRPKSPSTTHIKRKAASTPSPTFPSREPRSSAAARRGGGKEDWGWWMRWGRWWAGSGGWRGGERS